ncbi:autophagy- protein 2 [Gaertneriomyces sp. JEL0708]|nr:autophagy- protein 2 [Gaertneriomyces sp. JEL0708]
MSSLWPFAGWYLPQSLQKRLVKFLLKRAIGQFLASELVLDNLDVELAKGQVVLRDLELNIELLNELVASLPIIVTSGKISEIRVTVPWKDITGGECTLELDNICVEVTPLSDDPHYGVARSAHLSESHILSSSIHFAETFLRHEASDQDAESTSASSLHTSENFPPAERRASSLEGLQFLANVIDAILARVKVVVTNTTVRLRRKSEASDATAAAPVESDNTLLEFVISSLTFCDEQSAQVSSCTPTSSSGTSVEQSSEPTVKILSFSGIQIRLATSFCELGDRTAYGDGRHRLELVAATKFDAGDHIRIIMGRPFRETPTSRDPRHNLEAHCCIQSVCALLVPQQLSALEELLDLLSRGNRMLDAIREESSAVRTRTASNASSSVYATAYTQGHDLDCEAPLVQVSVDIQYCNIYLTYEPLRPPFDLDKFLKVYFTWKAQEKPLSASSPDLSMSFVTHVNTKVNAGPEAVEGMLGELLEVDHLMFALECLSFAHNGIEAVGGEIETHEAHICEWTSGDTLGLRRRAGSSPTGYVPLLLMGAEPEGDERQSMYGLLRDSEPPPRFTAKYPRFLSRHRNYDPVLRCQFRSVTSERDTSTETNIKLGRTELYLDLPTIARLQALLGNLSVESRRSAQPKNSALDEDVPSSGAIIMDDLERSELLNTSNANRRFSIRSELFRVWVTLPRPNEANESPEELEVPTVIMDVFDPVVTAPLTGDSSILASQPAYDGRLRSRAYSDSISDNSKRYTLECHGVGLSLGHVRQNKRMHQVTLKPLLYVSSASRVSSDLRGVEPNLELIVRTQVSETLLERPAAELYSTPSGLAFKREDALEQPEFGFRSWYDLGGAEHEPGNVDSKGKALEDDLLWFKHRVIQESATFLNCNFPECHLNILKEDYDLLQVLLNEFGASEPSLKPDGRRFPSSFPTANSPVGSYGSQSSRDTFMSAETSPAVSTDGKGYGSSQTGRSIRKPTDLTVLVTCDSFTATAHLTKPTAADDRPATSSYSCSLTDIRAFFVDAHDGKPVTYLWLDADHVSVSGSRSPEGAAVRYLHRTIPSSAKPGPMLASSFVLNYDEELKMKETTASVNIGLFTLRRITDTVVVSDIQEFLKEPPEIVIADLASRFTRLYVNLSDAALEYQPLHLPSQAILRWDEMKLSCNLISESPTTSVKCAMYDSSLWLSPDSENEQSATGIHPNARSFLASQGFCPVAACDRLEVAFRANTGGLLPAAVLEVTNNHLTIDTCADTYQTLMDLVSQVDQSKGKDVHGNQPIPERSGPMASATQPTGPDLPGDLLASLDEQAFGASTRRTLQKVDVQMEDMDTLLEDSILIQLAADSDDERSVTHGENSSVAQQRLSTDKLAGNNILGPNGCRQSVFRVLNDTDLINNFFTSSVTKDVGETEKGPSDNACLQLRIRDVDISWNIYDGYDWARTRASFLEVARKLNNASTQGKESSVGQDGDDRSDNGCDPDEYSALAFASSFPPTLYGFHTPDGFPGPELDRDDTASVHSYASGCSSKSRETNPATRNVKHRRRPITSQDLQRSRASQMIVKAYRANMELDVYSATCLTNWRLTSTIGDVEIIDNVRTSRWRKFLSYLRPTGDELPRETSSSMVTFHLSSVRPSPGAADELRLKLQLLPIRMHVDQDALNCLIRFFSFKSPGVRADSEADVPPDSTFYQTFDIEPISLRVDYKPKKVDFANLRGGNYVEMLNFFPLEGAEMTLRRVRLSGVQGFSKILEGVLSQWLPHIKNTQVPNMMSGVSGVRSLMNLGSGLADLVVLPIEQYKKDGRMMRGLQKGARSFARAATTETIKLGTRLAVGAQVLLEHADDLLVGDQSEDQDDHEMQRAGPSGQNTSKWAEQPKDIKEGVALAYRSLTRNVATAARTVLAIPMEVQENTGPQGTARAVIRAVPVAVLKPMIGATEAVSKALMGLQNSLDPQKRLQLEDKYKS